MTIKTIRENLSKITVDDCLKVYSLGISTVMHGGRKLTVELGK